MYSVTKIKGKDLGCIAKKKIKKGSLILREKPSLVLSDEAVHDENIDQLLPIIDAYLKMDNADKEEYLNLANKYMVEPGPDVDEEFIKSRTAIFDNSITNRLSKMKLSNINLETAQRVYQVFETNAFHNGVCLKMSRFNHSCNSNAEYFWNTDEQIRDLRAIRNIGEGEEITVNYKGTEILNVNERAQYLMATFLFFCYCGACDISDDDFDNEIEKCQKFKKLKEQRVALQAAQNPHDYFMYINIKQEVECLKEMYKIAKELKILRIITMIDSIVEPGFDASCQGFYNLCLLKSSLPEKAQFLKDANNFASVGLQLSTMVLGGEHSTSIEWQKRKMNPIKFFKDEWASKQGPGQSQSNQ